MIADALGAERAADNLDTIFNPNDPHDADNVYGWSATGTAVDGTVWTVFLPNLNNCGSSDGSTITGGFAGHCDWRLPTSAELQTIVDLTASGCGSGSPCIFSAFGPTKPSDYWSAITENGFPLFAWTVDFNVGGAISAQKGIVFSVRAVRNAP